MKNVPASMSQDYVAQHFVNYMFDNATTRHVQRVASWIGLLVLAIKARRDEWKFWHNRQLVYRVDETWYKVRYSHTVGTRGGVQIVEMLDSKTDGDVVRELTTLEDVEEFYLSSRRHPGRARNPSR